MLFERITSRNNDKIKQTVRLMKSSKERNTHRLFVIEGTRLCMDAVQSGIDILWLMVSEKAAQKYAEQTEVLAAKAEHCFVLEQAVMQKITDTECSQEVVCVCKMPHSEPFFDMQGKYVAVENLSNPANLGALARTSEALGLSGMLLIGNSCDPYSPKALRASMGSLLRLPLIFVSYLQLEELKQQGFQLYCSVVHDGAEPVTDVPYVQGSAMIIGNEGNGVSEQLKALSDRLVTIPISGKAESFNAAAAGAILLWEYTK